MKIPREGSLKAFNMADQSIPLHLRLKRESHRICSLILNSDLQWFDISLQINRMRDMVLCENPQNAELFDHLYLGRFERLWDQWRLEAAQPGQTEQGWLEEREELNGEYPNRQQKDQPEEWHPDWPSR